MPPFIPFPKAEIEQSIPQRFETQVTRFATSPAVKIGESVLSYNALNEYANRIAQKLIEGFRPQDTPVIILMDQGIPFIAATLGTLKARRFYAPLDVGATKADLVELVRSLKPAVILTDNEHKTLGRQIQPTGVELIDVETLDTTSSAENPNLLIASESLAYVYFTSGSTGKRKGVMDTHRNVLHNVMRYTNSLKLCHEDRLSLLHPAHFSACVSSQFGALLNGACIFPHPVTPETIQPLPQWLNQQSITVYHSVPQVFQYALDETTRSSSLRIIRLEGDVVHIEHLRLFKAHAPAACTLVNGLGTTETGLCTQFFFDHNSELPESTIPIGYPVEDMSVRVIDDSSNEVTDNSVGEFVIQSEFLSPGYWQDSEATRKAFSQHPEHDKLRRWKTGDLGSIQTSGCIHHLGRLNDKGNKVQPRPHMPPKSPTEIQLAAIWTQILNRPTVGLQDDFFECGGNSISAIQIKNRIQEQFSVTFSIKDIFDNRTLIELSNQLDQQLKASQSTNTSK